MWTLIARSPSQRNSALPPPVPVAELTISRNSQISAMPTFLAIKSGQVISTVRPFLPLMKQEADDPLAERRRSRGPHSLGAAERRAQPTCRSLARSRRESQRSRQRALCPPLSELELIPLQTLFKEGHFSSAIDMYTEALSHAVRLPSPPSFSRSDSYAANFFHSPLQPLPRSPPLHTLVSRPRPLRRRSRRLARSDLGERLRETGRRFGGAGEGGGGGEGV